MKPQKLFFLFGMLIGVSAQYYRGVNIAGGEWGGWSNIQSINHFLMKGFNTIRIPFAWEKIQPQLGGALNEGYLHQLALRVNFTTNKGAFAILDLHNYMRYNNKVQTAGNIKNVWFKIAQRFKNNPKVIWGLMNEPNKVKTEDVLTFSQGALDGVRSTGAKQLALIPGNGWCSAGGWTSSFYGTPNSQVMIKIKDPANNYVFEMHTYFDADYSGTSTQCKPGYDAAKELGATTKWLRAVKRKAFLGEFGFGENANCYKSGTNFLNYMKANKDVYIGWTAWAAGSTWPAKYELLIEPTGGKERGQVTQVLQRYARG